MIKPFYCQGIIVGLMFLSACKGGSPDLSNSSNAPASQLSNSESSSTSEVAAVEAPPPPPNSAFIALLSPAQTEAIKALGVPLVVPTAIPSGFSVDQVESIQDEWFTTYQIVYRDNGDRCFLVEYTTGGVGSIPDTEYRVPINPPLFDDGEEYALNYGSYVDSDIRAQFPEPELVSDWLSKGEDGVYRLAGAAYINSTLAPSRPCQDITPEEAVTVIESFALITDEIIGDE